MLVATNLRPGRFVSIVPHYYFNLYNDVVTLDEEGRELPNPDSAWDSAIETIRDLMKEDLDKGRITLAHRIEIADEYGRILRTVSFAEAVTIEE